MSKCPHCRAKMPLWRTEYGWMHIKRSDWYSRTTFTCPDQARADGFTSINGPWEKVR